MQTREDCITLYGFLSQDANTGVSEKPILTCITRSEEIGEALTAAVDAADPTRIILTAITRV
jgi:hypothetical protein